MPPIGGVRVAALIAAVVLAGCGAPPRSEQAVRSPAPARAPVAAEPTSSTVDPRIASASGDAFPDSEVQLVMREEGLDEASARLLLALGHSSPALGEVARATYPTTYAGVWIDRPSVRVMIAFTRDAEASAAALARDYLHGDRLEAVTVTHSLAELEAAQATLAEVGAREQGVRSTGVDVVGGQLLVVTTHCLGPVRAALDALIPGIPVDLQLAGQPGRPAPSPDPDCVGVPPLPEPTATPDGGEPFDLVTHDEPQVAYDFSGTQGVLTGGLVEGRHCLWLERSDGQTTSVLWPYGFSGRTDPYRLVNADGHVVARAGDEMSLGGSGGDGGALTCAEGATGLWGAAPVFRVERARAPRPADS